MTAKEMEKIIVADGWYLVSINGSHHNYKHPTKVGRVTIPFHNGDIPKGTLASIYKQAGLK
jgi:predicted RNA binding protein YcfA (HicA-like mRNA interferase family)